MKQRQVLRTVFPTVITENFEFTDYKDNGETLEYWLEEREYMSREDYKSGTVRPPMALPSIRQSRIFPSVANPFIFVSAAVNGWTAVPVRYSRMPLMIWQNPAPNSPLSLWLF